MKSIVRIILCLSCLVIGLGTACSQSPEKSHSIGFQVNPYLDFQFFDGIAIKPVYAVRYTFNLTEHLKFGPEISGYYVKTLSDQYDLHISTVNFGGYIRYSFMPKARINPFIELSPYYSFHHFKSADIVTPTGIGKEVRNSFLTGYASPGISLASKSQKLSLDLFYKFSNKGFINGNKAVFSYRFNVNF
jgi:hypothetical protein